MKDEIGDRFKAYEAVSDYALPKRLPMVIRLDGRAFHSLRLSKPFDDNFHAAMAEAAKALCADIQGAVLAFFQSDEISIIARDDMKVTTEPWFGKRLSKINSVAASIATDAFTRNSPSGIDGVFDCRAFVLPDFTEVLNYLIWRQKDATRNSVSMVARSVFSHKQCDRKSTRDLIAMLDEAGHSWDGFPRHYRYGTLCVQRHFEREVPQTGEMCMRREWVLNLETPEFTSPDGAAFVNEVFYGEKLAEAAE